MKKENWVWMPHAAHLIVSRHCQFRLATYVGKYIVSTVGEYSPDRQVKEIHAEVHNKEWWLLKNRQLRGDEFDNAFMVEFGFIEIGGGRTYETMVFKAKKSSHKCCPYEASDYSEIDSAGYNDAGDAYSGHLKLCQKWGAK